MLTIKVTLHSNDRQSVDTLIAVKDIQDYNANRINYKQYALSKICTEHGWRYSDLTKYGYTKISVKVHNRQIY